MKNIYRAGLLSLAILSFAGITPSRAAETVLYRFTGGNDGAYPRARLIADEQGALYGTTYKGGLYDYGTVFKLTPPAQGHTTWTETVLYNFCSQSSCNDGSYPRGSLVADANGALYGTTEYGGGGPESGSGAVFKLEPPARGHTTWTETVLWYFLGDDYGAYPVAGLVFGKDGALYGTTEEGGYGPFSIGYGTVFKLAPPAPGHTMWTETQLYTFCRVGYYCNDGSTPQSGLTFGKDGALYGTTKYGGSSGGTSDCGLGLDGCGTVFRLTPPPQGHKTWAYSVIHNFVHSSNGNAYPAGELVFGTHGTLYGATSGATQHGNGNGSVFKLTPPATGGAAWQETTLHTFGYCPWLSNPVCSFDGAEPSDGVFVAADGVIYGTTTVGGSAGLGTIFSLTPPPKNAFPAYWYENILHDFGSGQDGAVPAAGLIPNQGALYGTTENGGIDCDDGIVYGCGTVFKLTLPEPTKGRKPKL